MMLVPEILRAAALTALLAAPALAQSGERLHFEGGGFVGDFTDCPAGWSATEPITAKFVPAFGLPDSEGVARLSLFFAGGTENMQRVGAFTTYMSWVTGRQIWEAFGLISPRPSLRVVSRDPEVIDADTASVRLVVRIRNFNGNPDCNALVGLVMHR